MSDATITRDQLASTLDHLRRLLGEREDEVSSGLCRNGCHLELAYRWTPFCESCGQTVVIGPVGITTWFSDQPFRCVEGGRSFQHGCGVWNMPTSVEYDDLHDRVVRQLEVAVRDDGEEGDLAEVLAAHPYFMREAAEALVDHAVAELHAAVGREQARAAALVRERLLHDVSGALSELHTAAETLRATLQDTLGQRACEALLLDASQRDAGAALRTHLEDLPAAVEAAGFDDEGDLEDEVDMLADRVGVHHPTVESPGVVVDGGLVAAWDVDPRDPRSGDIIEVSEADLEVVALPVVARLAGVSDETVERHLQREAMPLPLPTGGRARVWRRRDVVEWAAARRAKGGSPGR